MIFHSQKTVVLAANATLGDEGPMPDLGGAVGWLNSTPLSSKSLRLGLTAGLRVFVCYNMAFRETLRRCWPSIPRAST